jgi:hypothetical protein
MEERNKATMIYLTFGLLFTVVMWLVDPTLRPQIPPDQIVPAFLMAVGIYTLSFFIVRAFYATEGEDALTAVITAWKSEDKTQRYVARGGLMVFLLFFSGMFFVPKNMLINILLVLMSLTVVCLVLGAIVAAFYVALKARPTE